MLPEERRRQILAQLAEQGSVRVADLAQALDVTPVTIRRDLELLSSLGSVKRVHGGVTLREQGAAGVAGPEPLSRAVRVPAGKLDTAPPVTGSAVEGESALALAVAAPEAVVGMVVPSLDYYWPSVARGAKEQAAKRGVKVLLRESAYASAEQDRKQIQHLVQQAGVQALLLTVDTGDPKTLELLGRVTEQGVHVVLIERQAVLPSDGAPMESVTSDHRSGAVLAVKTLTDMGHRKIGIVCPRKSPTAPHLFAGWQEACEERGLSPEETLTEVIDNDTPAVLNQQVGEVLDKCLERGITAVMVHADPEANAMVQVAQQRGLQVPGDLSVVAYDDEVASLFSPPLTAVRPPRYTIGATAVDLAAGRLADPGRPVHRVTLSPRLTVRESIAAPADRGFGEQVATITDPV